MAEILFVSPGPTINLADLQSKNDARSLDERIAAIERMNPSINGKSVNVSRFTPIIIPANENDEKMCTADFRSTKAAYTALPLDAKKSINDIGADEAFSLLQAIQQFKDDYLPEYEIIDTASDTNTFAGGLVGAQLARTASVVKQMKYIESLLLQYKVATGAQRAQLKPLIKATYKSLNNNFVTVLSKYIERSGKLGGLQSSRQGMKAALKGRTTITNSVKAKALVRAASGFRYAQKGLVALDVGFRIHRVINSTNMGRTLTLEAFGFGAAYYTGSILGTLAVALTLGPLGWIIAIIVIGVAVVSADYIGKSFGNLVYDAGSSLYNNSTMRFAY